MLRKSAQAVLIGFFFSQAAFAADQKLPNLIAAVVDSVQIMNDSTAVKGIQEKIEKERAKYQEEISKKEGELRQENERLMAEQKKLPAKDFEKKRKKFETQVEDVKVLVDDRRKNLESAYNTSIGTVNNKFMEIAKRVAQEKAANIVFQRAIVIALVDPSMDITQEVTLALNKELPEVPVVFSSEKPISTGIIAPAPPEKKP